MIRNVILDTGPLVAWLNRRDRHHSWACDRLAEIAAPLTTCEAVLSEACFLLRRSPAGTAAIFAALDRGLIELDFELRREAQAVAHLLERFAEQPMDFADACLVRMAEQRSGSTVLTLDQDFRVYRMHGRRVVPTVLPSR